MKDIIKREVEIIKEIRNQIQDNFMPGKLDIIITEIYKKIEQPLKFKYLKGNIENLHIKYSTAKALSDSQKLKDTAKSEVCESILCLIERIDSGH